MSGMDWDGREPGVRVSPSYVRSDFYVRLVNSFRPKSPHGREVEKLLETYDPCVELVKDHRRQHSAPPISYVVPTARKSGHITAGGWVAVAALTLGVCGIIGIASKIGPASGKIQKQQTISTSSLNR